MHGTLTFETEEDKVREQELAHEIELAWGIRLHQFGQYSPIDWWVSRRGCMAGFLELKGAKYSIDRYPHALLSFAKFRALEGAQKTFGKPSILMVRWTDAIRWLPVDKINSRYHRIVSRDRPIPGPSDTELCIMVPTQQMQAIDT